MTIVTAYYRFPSKHTYEEYDEWISNFVRLERPVVFFGEAEWCERFYRLRGNLPTQCCIAPLSGLRSQHIADWDYVLANDKFQHLHNKNLYVVWNEKPEFVSKSIKANPFKSNTFAWVDIGCFRNGINGFSMWPRLTQSSPMAKIIMSQVEPWASGDKDVNAVGLPADFHGTNRVSGTILIGGKTVWQKWIPAYYDMVSRFVKAKRHCGLDGNVLSALAATRDDLVELVVPPDGVNKWFYLQEYFI